MLELKYLIYLIFMCNWPKSWYLARAGAIHQLGHMDFYPGGGSVQYGCSVGPDWAPGGM